MVDRVIICMLIMFMLILNLGAADQRSANLQPEVNSGDSMWSEIMKPGGPVPQQRRYDPHSAGDETHGDFDA